MPPLFHILRHVLHRCVAVIMVFMSVACGHLADPADRAADIAAQAGLRPVWINSSPFRLLSFQRITRPDQVVTIYIEGDGRAWRTKYQPSNDPTPRNPLALRLAALDPAPNVVYLARPCQYVMTAGGGENCRVAHWTGRRYGPEIVEALDRAVSALLSRHRGRGAHLVGYSGGGALAVLIAARRPDILSVRSVAGNLDPAAVNTHHGVSPLTGSLDPVQAAARLGHLPQIHFTGQRDSIVPPFIARRFTAALPNTACARVVTVAEAEHNDGWTEVWPDLLSLQPGCAARPNPSGR